MEPPTGNYHEAELAAAHAEAELLASPATAELTQDATGRWWWVCSDCARTRTPRSWARRGAAYRDACTHLIAAHEPDRVR